MAKPFNKMVQYVQIQPVKKMLELLYITFAPNLLRRFCFKLSRTLWIFNRN